MGTHALHFGVVPTDEASTATVDGHEDASTEHRFEVNGFEITVSGSWACWGSADQEMGGDNSLHVLTVVDADSDDEAVDVAGRVGDELASRLGRGSRLLDYGVVSAPNTWSEDQHIFLRYGGGLYGRVQ